MAKKLVDPVTGKTVKFYSRRECGLPKSRAPSGQFERSNAIAHHGVGRGNGLSLASCMAIWRGYHRYHTQSLGWNDIGYTDGWCDAVDVGGAVLEGRHWGKNGAHTQNGGNSRGYACCYIGDGRYSIAESAWRAWRAWLLLGVKEGAFSKNFKVTGHDDWFNKVCPGGFIKSRLHEKSKFNAETVDEEEEDMVAPVEVVTGRDDPNGEKHRWLVFRYNGTYRRIKTATEDRTWTDRAERDDVKWVVKADQEWQPEWFAGLKFEE